VRESPTKSVDARRADRRDIHAGHSDLASVSHLPNWQLDALKPAAVSNGAGVSVRAVKAEQVAPGRAGRLSAMVREAYYGSDLTHIQYV
jgi:hypothetical protein